MEHSAYKFMSGIPSEKTVEEMIQNDQELIDKIKDPYLIGYLSGLKNINMTYKPSDGFEEIYKQIKLLLPELKYIPSLDAELAWESISKKEKRFFILGFFNSCAIIQEDPVSVSVTCDTSAFAQTISTYIKLSCKVDEKVVTWEGVNAVDLFGSLYTKGYKSKPLIKPVTNKITQMMNNKKLSRFPTFKWKKVLEEAVSPVKQRYSDTGFDLHLVAEIKRIGDVTFYDTGIQIQPEDGYYFDLVGRSSISKCGYMIANNVGIIDASYRGNIIVALLKYDKTCPDLELPCRMVQLIPRQLVLCDMEEVETLNTTERGVGGFGSSG